jgi:hypothetical protein
MRRIGVRFDGGNYAAAVTPAPFEVAAITVHADQTAK